jgi:hypothetical protein
MHSVCPINSSEVVILLLLVILGQASPFQLLATAQSIRSTLFLGQLPGSTVVEILFLH